MATREDAAAPAAPPHLLVVPLPLQGHLSPCLCLAHYLASAGVSLTLVQPSYNYNHLISTATTAHDSNHHALTAAAAEPQSVAANSASAANPSIPFRIEGIPWGFDPSKPFALPTLISSVHLMCQDVTQLLRRLDILLPQTNAPVINCLLIDSFFPWGASVAAQFGLSYVSLYTSPASIFCLGCHVPDLVAGGFIPATEQGAMDKIIDFIPGLSPFRVADMPKRLTAEEGLQSDIFVFFTSRFQCAKSADRILVNTIYELESSAIEALRREYNVHIDPVGPLFMISMPECGSSISLRPTDSGEDNACIMSWLEQQQEESSVLYIAFGSLAAMQEQVLAEIAHGLEASGERFVWVVRRLDETASSAALPQGFVERTRGRGRVISWAPQVTVLGHRSVGAFLTHCGWNSVLESLSNGVPMLGFPQMAEQNTNLKLMVHDWKVALPLVNINQISAHSADLQQKVERRCVQSAITAIMRGAEGTQVRMRAREWKELARQASQGSSKHNLQKLVHDLKQGLVSSKRPKLFPGMDYHD